MVIPTRAIPTRAIPTIGSRVVRGWVVRGWVVRGWVAFTCAVLCLPLVADEPTEAFLKALRDHGHYDVAIEYLQRMESSPLASAEFKRRIQFEMAGVYLDQLETLRDIDAIEQAIDAADQLLLKFAASNPPAELLAESALTRATALFARGRVSMQRGQLDRATADERRAAYDTAREYFDRALEAFQSSLDTQADVLRTYRIDPADPGSRDRLEGLRAEYVKTRFMAPAIKEQIADTLLDDDYNRRKLLKEAAEQYRELYEKYGRYRQGSYSRFTAARCHQKLGECDEALTLLVDLLADEIPRSLKLDAALVALECWEAQRPPAYQDIAGRVGPLLEEASVRELRDAKLARLQLGYARACHQFAQQLAAGANADQLRPEIRRLDEQAAKFARSVARQNSNEGAQARELLSEWNVSSPANVAPTDSATALSLLEARDQAALQIEMIVDYQRTLQALQNDATADDRDARIEQTSAALRVAADEALRLLELGRKAAGPETSLEDRNSLIVRQCQLRLLMGELYEAAVLGEFLTKRFPQVAGSRDAAQLALRAYTQMLPNASDEDRAFVVQRLNELGQAMVQLWPGEAAADDAANILATLAIQSGDFDRAMQLLDSMQSGSAGRAKLEVIIGRLLWVDYLKNPEASAGTAAADNPRLQRAAELIRQGLAGFSPENLTAETVVGTLNLAQIYLEQGAIDQAIEQLETAKLAPLDLIKQKIAVALDPNFVNDTYRTALRAYLAGMRDGAQTTELTDKAQAVVAALQQSMGDDQEGEDQVLRIYYQLARELLGQLDRIQSAAEKDSFSQSLAAFMRTIQERADDAKTLVWVASTLNSVADNLDAEGLTQNSGVIRGQAVAALDQALRIGFPPDGSDTESLQLELKRQKALALRGQNKLDAALDTFAEILASKPNLINAQVEAAVTLQRKADQDRSATLFAEAVSGWNDRPLWGWRKIVLATRGNDSFAAIYYDAIYNLAYCQFRFGEIQKRDDAKQAALKTLVDQHRQYPQLGGGDNLQRFNELAKQIQSSLGQTATGL